MSEQFKVWNPFPGLNLRASHSEEYGFELEWWTKVPDHEEWSYFLWAPKRKNPWLEHLAAERTVQPGDLPLAPGNESIESLLARANTFLAECGWCDYGLPMKCACPPGDYRSVILDLVREIERSRIELSAVRDAAHRRVGAYQKGSEQACADVRTIRRNLVEIDSCDKCKPFIEGAFNSLGQLLDDMPSSERTVQPGGPPLTPGNVGVPLEIVPGEADQDR